MADVGERASCDAWGDDISDERKAYLEQRLQAWEQEAEHGEQKGPFDARLGFDYDGPKGILTGADVFWLAARALAGTSRAQVVAEHARLLRTRSPIWLSMQVRLDGLHLEGACFAEEAHLEGAYLQGAHLEGAYLQRALLERADLRVAHLEGAYLEGAHLERADLHGAHLERADLGEVHLEGAALNEAHLEEAILGRAHLEGALLNYAHLEGVHSWHAHLEVAQFGEAHLEGADLKWTHLEGAYLGLAYLEKADLRFTHLEGAFLMGAHLEGAYLGGTHLEGKTYSAENEDYQRMQQWVNKGHTFSAALSPVDLRGAFFDATTTLTEATLGDASSGGVSVADVSWGDVNLAVVDWSQVAVLGDEREARETASEKKLPHTELESLQTLASERVRAFQAAARANRQLATALRNQGMADEANHFAYRAQLMQRTGYRLQRRYGQWLFSWLLSLLAGYGYRLERILISYVLIVGVFAAGFLISDVVSGQGAWTLPHALDALQISLNAIHGRVFFAQFHLDTIQSWLATAESVVGIVIEGIFVAMLIQRYFAR